MIGEVIITAVPAVADDAAGELLEAREIRGRVERDLLERTDAIAVVPSGFAPACRRAGDWVEELL